MVTIVDNVLTSTQDWTEVMLKFDLPFVDLVFDQCRQTVEEFGDHRRWLVDATTGETSLVKDVEAWTYRVAASFQKIGLSPGDTVTIISRNRVDYPIPIFAAWLCGASASLLDPAVEKTTLAEQLKAVKSKIIVCTQDKLGTVNDVLDIANEDLPKIYVFADEGRIADEDHIITNIYKDENVSLDHFNSFATDDKTALAMTLWSSGSTGKPKGIMIPFSVMYQALSQPLTHPLPWPTFNYIYSFRYIRPVLKVLMKWAFRSPPIRKFSMGTWMYHIGGFFVATTIIRNTEVFFTQPDEMSPEVLYKAIADYQPINVIISFHDIIRLSNSCPDSNLDLSSVKVLTPVGSGLPQGTKEKLQSNFPSLRFIWTAYGSTEVGGTVSTSMTEESPCIGIINPHTMVKIVDVKSGKKCEPNQLGEICVKSDTMMLGYINGDGKSGFDQEGFFHMGDMGYYDTRGILYFSDRIKDLIKCGLHHVYPGHAEQVLESHPSIVAAGVFGIPNDVFGEICAALVVRKAGEHIEENDLIKWANGNLPDWERIKGIKFVPNLPHNSLGKKVRKEMKTIWFQI